MIGKNGKEKLLFTLSSTSLSYNTERRERDGEMRGEPRDRNFKAAMLK
jgi:hypothetical protein